MNINLPHWLSGLGQSGWIAIGLLVTFVVIASLTVIMIWKVIRDTRKYQSKNKPEHDEISQATPPRRTATKVAASQGAPKKVSQEEADPVAEAEVYMTYGLYKQAITVLEKHLAANPSDMKASKMLGQARKKS